MTNIGEQNYIRLSGSSAFSKVGAGDKLKFTGRFLRNTGQIVGGEGHAVFTVVEHDCRMCKSGLFVAVDQASTQEDENGNSIGPRHILASNLFKVGTVDVSNLWGNHETTDGR